MNSNITYKADTICHLEEMVEKLNNEQMITKEEHEKIGDDLNELQDVRSKKIREHAMNNKLDTLLNEFSDGAEASRQFLNQVLENVTEGKIPDVDTVQQMNSAIEGLRNRYETIRFFAEEVLPAEEMPAEGSSAFDYADAINNSKALQYKKQIADIKELLERFISVKALMEQYTEALLPFQDKAKEMLLEIKQETMTLENVLGESSNATLFMEAFEHDNVADAKGADLLQKVAQNMNFMVQIGLATNNYYLENSERTTNSTNHSEEVKPEGKDSTKEADTNPRSESQDKSTLTEDVENPSYDADSLSQGDPEAPVIEDAAVEESEFVKQVRAQDLILKNNDCFGDLVEDASTNENKKLSATIFSNDIRKGNVKAAKNIIKALCRNISMTESALAKETKMPEDLLSITLSQLMKKGYIRRYSIKHGEIIAPSPRLKEALSYKSASNFAEVKQNCLIEYDNLKLGEENIAAAFIAISNVREELGINPNAKSTSTTMSMGNGGFAIRVYHDDNIDNCNFILGNFWNNVEECDSFASCLDEQLQECGSASNFVFAALNFEIASRFAELLMERYNLETYQAKVRLYSLEENALKNIDEAKKVEENISDDVSEALAKPLEDIENEKEATEIQKERGLDDEDDFSIESMLADGFFYAATAYAKADAKESPEKETLYNQLKYAFNEPSGKCTYTSTNLYNLISNSEELENALVLSAALRTFFSNQVKYDYDLKSVYGALNEYALLDLVTPLRQVMYDMSEFKSKYNTGLDYYADYHKRDQKEIHEELAKLRKEATDFYNKNVIGVIKEKTGHRRFLETNKLIFSANSEFGEHLKFVVDGELDAKDLILDFLSNHFYSPESIISESTIDEALLWDYIQGFWDEAGQQMATKKRDDLKSHLRSNITNRTTKAVQLLAKWCSLVEMLDDHDEDAGAIAYKKLHNNMLNNISEAIAALAIEEQDSNNSKALVAGMRVLEYTLSEIKSCLDGTFDEQSRKYFYKDFLLTDNVMLDDLFIPDMDIHTSSLEALSVQERIKKHLSQIKGETPSFEKRLSEILEEQGDDLGAAKLIVEYLSAYNPDTNYDAYSSDISDSIAYAKETAELRKADFIGELELAQSYGQIDNSTEDQKEIILKAVDEWFEWADSSANYGFFKKVIDEYMSDIRRNAKKREKDILEELEAFKTSSNSELSIDAKERKIVKILAAVKEQNYTVAEDLLSRDDFDDDTSESLIAEDFLKIFLENYDDFYQPVATKTANLSYLVKNRTRNKEERGAKRLADNWLPGGSKIGKIRLETLLKNLGFDIERVVEQNTIGRFEEYFVTTVGGFKRQRNSYTHPIAALGSGAAEAGFRVVCLNGAYDADNLIDLMKQIGNAKHTLILLDYALSKSERRRLARKTKSTLGDKLFAVIDRTVMMFLIRYYDETKINRMLVSLITPFAYYQPYVWESANVMPPEIFMGRKLELEKIKSPSGVNIVYGGRQLGKSALLKKAKEDIDWNENGDRAVYIDIKGLDYKETARKIGHELVDQFILKEDIDTDNWEELARAVRRRLQSDEDRIPYLLLLLDEADAFIESCSEINYKPFDSLKEIQGVGASRFKFVVAGLRDIVRFKRDALSNNSVLTHLEPMTVTPFKFSEARELMEIPLHYLGFRFPKDKESLITLIMATTNYFPGLIQLYCAKLIEAMRNKDYAGYDQVDSPIYDVNEEHIKKVLSDPDFMQQIREKYIITLKLDEDNYYHLIALILAWLYHNEESKSGYSAEDIKRIGSEYGIRKLADLDISKLENFCEELKELNVLRKTEEHRYLFTRFTFFQMMGTADEVDTALLEYMEA